MGQARDVLQDPGLVTTTQRGYLMFGELPACGANLQEIMARRFFEKIGQGTIPRLGDVITDAKSTVVGGTDVRLSWALLGDPMLKVR